MDNERERQKKFVGYEYKEVITDSNKASIWIDGYENFGWELDENFSDGIESVSNPYQRKTRLRFKRDRKIVNKMELTRLQRNFEACVREIDTLEKSKTSSAIVWALVLGIIGTAFMAGSVFSIVVPTPHIMLCIMLAIPGFILWILPYFVYKKKAAKDAEKIEMLIDSKYDEIYELCEKGNKLLY